MIHSLLFLIAMAPLSPGASFATERERERQYDVLHYAIDIRVDEIARTVEGSVSMRIVPLTPLDSVTVDAGEMEILGINKGGRREEGPLKYSYDGRRLRIAMPEHLSTEDTTVLHISYSCSPRNGLHFVGPDEFYLDKPWQVWSQGEMEDNHFWFPCYDYPNDRATVEMNVTVNERFMAVSNGSLVETVHNFPERTKTYCWRSTKPFASYLISLVAGEYARLEEKFGNIPLEYYVYPGREKDALRSFSKTPAMMRFFSEKLGHSYPWPKYVQTVIADFTYGGMENTSASTLTDKTLHGARAHLDVSSDGLVAHELAHQWFGDLLTCRNWSHAWLNEGFATYMTALWFESEKGWDRYQYELMRDQSAVVESDTGVDRRATITDRYVDPVDVFDSRIYARGACILHMLRSVLGDEVFWKGLTHYVGANRYSEVVTADFQKAMEEASGEDLAWFFGQWTMKAGFPELEVYHRYEADSHRLHITVRQTQVVDDLTPLYRLPVDIEVFTGSGSFAHHVIVEPLAEQTLSIPLDERPLNVTFDKGNWLLKKMDHRKPVEEWLHQLGHGDVRARIDALKSIESRIDDPGVRARVVEVLSTDSFWGVREQAAKSLGRSQDSGTFALLAPAFQDTVSRVRVAATASLRSFKSLDALMALGSILATDSSYDVAAEAITSLAAIDSSNGMIYCEKGMDLDSHNDVIRSAALKAMGKLKTPEAKQRLMTMTGYGQSLEVRHAAIEALARNWKKDSDVRIHLQGLLLDPIQRVQRKAIEELGTIASSESRAPLSDFLKTTLDAILRREVRRAITKIDRALVASNLQNLRWNEE